MSRTLPDLIDAVYAAASASLPSGSGVVVHDGMPTTIESGDHLVIGVDDWDETRTKATSGSSTEDWSGATAGAGIDESGSITCAAWSGNGNSDQKAARDAVYTLHSGLRTLLLDAMSGPFPVFGVPGLWDVRLGGVDELTQAQDGTGAWAVIRFPIAYQARIPEE